MRDTPPPDDGHPYEYADDAGGLVVPIAPVRVGGSSALGILASLVPWLVVVHVLRGFLGGESGWVVALVTFLAAAAWALSYARPARMVGKGGEVRFAADGMHVTFDALMDDVWFVPTAHIGDVRCASTLPHLSERRVLGLTGRDANVLVRFKEPSPRVPVRGGFFLPAMVGGNRGRGVMPVPNTTVDQICWRVDTGDLAGLQRRIEAALKGEPVAETSHDLTYTAGRPGLSEPSVSDDSEADRPRLEVADARGEATHPTTK